MQALRSVLPELSASKAPVLLLQYNVQRLRNGLCHAPDPYISGTIRLHAPLVELFCPASNLSSQGKDFSIAHGSTEPLDSDLASVLHAVSF